MKKTTTHNGTSRQNHHIQLFHVLAADNVPVFLSLSLVLNTAIVVIRDSVFIFLFFEDFFVYLQ